MEQPERHTEPGKAKIMRVKEDFAYSEAGTSCVWSIDVGDDRCNRWLVGDGRCRESERYNRLFPTSGGQRIL